MNKTHYDLITDKRLKRYITILEQLHESKYPLTLEEIAQTANVSTRTISSDLESLNGLFPEDSLIKLSPKIGVQLQWDHSQPLAIWLESLLASDTLFVIIRGLFHNQTKTLEEWADELFISDVTLRKHCRLLVRTLKQFDLTLDLTPLGITGNEAHIRSFFFVFFKNFTDPSHRPAADPDSVVHYQAIIQSLVTNFDQTYQITMHLDTNRIISWLPIIKTRIEQGFHITILPAYLNLFFERESTNHFGQLYEEELIKRFDFSSVDRQEQLYFYSVCLDSVIYNGGLSFEKQAFSLEEDQVLFNELLEFTNLLASEFNLTAESPETQKKVIGTINAFLRNKFVLTRVTHLFQRNSFEINQQVKKMHPVSYARCLKVVTDSPLMARLKIVHFEDISVSLTMLLYSFIHANSLEKKRILFSLTGESTFINYASTMAANLVPSNIEVRFTFTSSPITEALATFEPDFFIYNYEQVTTNLTDCISIKIPPLPNLEDWSILYNLVSDISIKGMQGHFEF